MRKPARSGRNYLSLRSAATKQSALVHNKNQIASPKMLAMTVHTVVERSAAMIAHRTRYKHNGNWDGQTKFTYFVEPILVERWSNSGNIEW